MQHVFCLSTYLLFLSPLLLVSYSNKVGEVSSERTEVFIQIFLQYKFVKLSLWTHPVDWFYGFFFKCWCLPFFFIFSATAGSTTARCHQSLQSIKSRPALTLSLKEWWCLSSQRTERKWVRQKELVRELQRQTNKITDLKFKMQPGSSNSRQMYSHIYFFFPFDGN